MTTEFMISGKKNDIVGLVGTAARFTAQDSGAAAYLKCIHIKADSEVITMTGASEYNAIKVTEPVGRVSVDTPGEILVQSHWVQTALQVVQDDHYVALSYNGSTRKLVIQSYTKDNDPDQFIELDFPKIDVKAMVPDVGQPDLENFIVLNPEKFSNTYYSASVARDTQGTRPVIGGVLAVPDDSPGVGEEMKLRMMSMDARFKTAIDALPIEKFVGDGCGGFLLHDQPTRFVMDYLVQGDEIHMHRDGLNQMHFIVLDSEGHQRYHVRAATVNQPVESFPEAKMRQQLENFIPKSLAKISTDKAELLRILRNAATVGSLDSNNIGGQSKNIKMVLQDGEIAASVTTSASYEESIPASLTSIKSDGEIDKLEFVIKFGLHGHILESYHNEDDPSNIDFLILESPKVENKPLALLLYKKDPLNSENGSVSMPDYLAMFGVH